MSSLKTEVNRVNFIKERKIPFFGCLKVGFPEY